MLESIKAKIAIAIIFAIVSGLVTWKVLDWRTDAHKVPGLEKELAEEKQKVLDTIEQCKNSKQPAQEANNYDYTKLNASLNLCLDQLRKSPSACIPVHSAGSSNGAAATGGQQTGWIEEGQIVANNIGCQADRDALNAAKIWGQGYMKYKNEVENGIKN